MEYLKEKRASENKRFTRRLFEKLQKALGWFAVLQLWIPQKKKKREAHPSEARCLV
jgi:hypothetical protein